MDRDLFFVKHKGSSCRIPLSEVVICQVSPTDHNKVVQEISLPFIMEFLIEHNLAAFVKTHTDVD